MKKFILLAFPLLALLIILPQTGHAMKVKKFQHFYLGTWENTYFDCGTAGNTGDIEIKLTKIKKSGKITKAKVWFDNGRIGDMPAKGRIYWDNGVRKIRLRYNEDGWDYNTYVITGTITANAISGNYDHSSYYYYDWCPWGGTVDLVRE